MQFCYRCNRKMGQRWVCTPCLDGDQYADANEFLRVCTSNDYPPRLSADAPIPDEIQNRLNYVMDEGL